MQEKMVSLLRGLSHNGQADVVFRTFPPFHEFVSSLPFLSRRLIHRHTYHIRSVAVRWLTCPPPHLNILSHFCMLWVSTYASIREGTRERGSTGTVKSKSTDNFSSNNSHNCDTTTIQKVRFWRGGVCLESPRAGFGLTCIKGGN
jgi:hypothetical protein